VENRDDDVLRLITRILELRSKINSQINSLSSGLNKQEPKGEELRRLLKINGFGLSPDFSYREGDLHLTPDEKGHEEWRLAAMNHLDRLPSESQRCKECKYKEGLEEVLNILAVCGFVERGEGERELGPLSSNGQTRRRSTSSSYY